MLKSVVRAFLPILLTLSFLLAACQGGSAAPPTTGGYTSGQVYTTDAVQPQVNCSWANGDVMAAKDSGGVLTFLRSPVEREDLAVLAILQKYGPLPGLYGDALLRGVDDRTVRPYHDAGFVLWYFHEGLGLPAALPWTDSHARCRARTPRVESENFPGWVYYKVPHWARLNVPTDLLLAGPVCVQPKNMPRRVVHVPQITEGSFAGTTDVICGLPGRMQQIIAEGYDGVLFFFVVEEGG